MNPWSHQRPEAKHGRGGKHTDRDKGNHVPQLLPERPGRSRNLESVGDVADTQQQAYGAEQGGDSYPKHLAQSTPMDELAQYLNTMSGPSSVNPNNPLDTSGKPTPSANPSNPQFNPSLPGAFNNPSNPELNPSLPGSVNNPSNPEYNPSNPGAQTNPSNPMRNPSLPTALTNPSNPSLNPYYPGSLTNPANPMHNPYYPNPAAIGQPPTDLPPNASFPPPFLSSVWKKADNYTQDTREFADPSEPRASKPPEPKGCTCEQGHKLDCPVHGMDAFEPDNDHTWSLPEGWPVGYPQDQPRGWQQAVASEAATATSGSTSSMTTSGSAGIANGPGGPDAQPNQREPESQSNDQTNQPRARQSAHSRREDQERQEDEEHHVWSLAQAQGALQVASDEHEPKLLTRAWEPVASCPSMPLGKDRSPHEQRASDSEDVGVSGGGSPILGAAVGTPPTGPAAQTLAAVASLPDDDGLVKAESHKTNPVASLVHPIGRSDPLAPVQNVAAMSAERSTSQPPTAPNEHERREHQQDHLENEHLGLQKPLGSTQMVMGSDELPQPLWVALSSSVEADLDHDPLKESCRRHLAKLLNAHRIGDARRHRHSWSLPDPWGELKHRLYDHLMETMPHMIDPQLAQQAVHETIEEYKAQQPSIERRAQIEQGRVSFVQRAVGLDDHFGWRIDGETTAKLRDQFAIGGTSQGVGALDMKLGEGERSVGSFDTSPLSGTVSNAIGTNLHLGLSSQRKVFEHSEHPLEGDEAPVLVWMRPKQFSNLDDKRTSIIEVDHQIPVLGATEVDIDDSMADQAHEGGRESVGVVHGWSLAEAGARRQAADQLGWQPGNPGKGSISRKLEVKTWNTDGRFPNHSENTWPFRGVDEFNAMRHFTISPEGEVAGAYYQEPSWKGPIPAPLDKSLYDGGVHDIPLSIAEQAINSTTSSQRQAGETLPQEQRRWQQLKEMYPSSSQVEHQYPDGWTIQSHPVKRDTWRVGAMMRNCWQGGGNAQNDVKRGVLTPEQYAAYANKPQGGLGDLRMMSLHDPDDIPRVAFYHEPQRGVTSPLGMRNAQPDWEHIERIEQGMPTGLPNRVRQYYDLLDPNPWSSYDLPAEFNAQGPDRPAIISHEYPPHGTHQCQVCGQGFVDNGWTGWTPMADNQFGERTWICPNCQTHLKDEGRAPLPRGHWQLASILQGPMLDEAKQNYQQAFQNYLNASPPGSGQSGNDMYRSLLETMEGPYCTQCHEHPGVFNGLCYLCAGMGGKVATWRLAGETATQRLRRAQELEAQYGPDTSSVVHQFPDGWTMRQLKTYADAQREGYLMGNCFAHDSTETPHNIWYEEQAPTPTDPNCPACGSDDADFLNNDEMRCDGCGERYKPTVLSAEPGDYARHKLPQFLYSLRDQHNLPHASVDPSAEFGSSALGRHNADVNPEHMQRLQQWADNAEPEIREPLSPEFHNAEHALMYDAEQGRYYHAGISPPGASSEELYHVAPTVDRERIRAHGLVPADPHHNWERNQDWHPPTGVYAYPGKERADNQVIRHEFHRQEPHDIWRVPSDLGWQIDPDTGAGKVTQQPIPNPEFVEGPEHREYLPEYIDDMSTRNQRYPTNAPEAWDQRISGPQVYHGAPGAWPINEQGLRAHEPEVTQEHSPWSWEGDINSEDHPPGNYVWDSPERAWQYVADERFLDPRVYEVDASGLPLHPDPDTIHRDQGSYYIPKHVAPERITPQPKQGHLPVREPTIYEQSAIEDDPHLAAHFTKSPHLPQTGHLPSPPTPNATPLRHGAQVRRIYDEFGELLAGVDARAYNAKEGDHPDSNDQHVRYRSSNDDEVHSSPDLPHLDSLEQVTKEDQLSWMASHQLTDQLLVSDVGHRTVHNLSSSAHRGLHYDGLSPLNTSDVIRFNGHLVTTHHDGDDDGKDTDHAHHDHHTSDDRTPGEIARQHMPVHDAALDVYGSQHAWQHSTRTEPWAMLDSRPVLDWEPSVLSIREGSQRLDGDFGKSLERTGFATIIDADGQKAHHRIQDMPRSLWQRVTSVGIQSWPGQMSYMSPQPSQVRTERTNGPRSSTGKQTASYASFASHAAFRSKSLSHLRETDANGASSCDLRALPHQSSFTNPYPRIQGESAGSDSTSDRLDAQTQVWYGMRGLSDAKGSRTYGLGSSAWHDETQTGQLVRPSWRQGGGDAGDGEMRTGLRFLSHQTGPQERSDEILRPSNWRPAIIQSGAPVWSPVLGGSEDSPYRELWTPNDIAHFEYHCNRAHDSADADLWYRSHQPVTVLGRNPGEMDEPWDPSYGPIPQNMNECSEYGIPYAYQVRFRLTNRIMANAMAEEKERHERTKEKRRARQAATFKPMRWPGRNGGDYVAYECPRCKALVTDPEEHIIWHDRLGRS